VKGHVDVTFYLSATMLMLAAAFMLVVAVVLGLV
jgi:hypothetical protein